MSPAAAAFPLFKLPQELRLKIYAHYFYSLNPTYPHYLVSPPLLLTSRSVYDAAQPLHIKNTRLDLTTTWILLDFLASLSTHQIKQLRYLSFSARSLMIDIEPGRRRAYYDYHQILPLFPDLQLDTLTLTDPFHGSDIIEVSRAHEKTYDQVKNLVEQGSGWRKLFYRSKSTAWLRPEFEYRVQNGVLVRHRVSVTLRQPGNWDRMIKTRDGSESGAGVRMWMQESDKWVEIPAVDEDEFPWLESDLQWADLRYRERSDSVRVEIQVTRGRDADIVDKVGPLGNGSKELLDLWGRMGWDGIKESGRFFGEIF